MLHQHRTGCINDANRAGRGNLKGLVVRAILLCLLRHQAYVRDAAHRAGVERAVGTAEVDDLLVDSGVGAVGDDRLGVLRLARSVPHLARLAEHRRHRSVDDDIARHMQIGDALVGVHHRNGRAVRQRCSDVCLDGCALRSRELRQLLDHVAEAVVHINAEPLKGGAMLGPELLEEDLDRMAEDDGVRDLHHRRLHVEREEDPRLLGIGNLRVEEGDERSLAHEGTVEDLAGLQREPILEHLHAAVCAGPFNADLGRSSNGHRLLVVEEIARRHGRDMRLGVRRPGTHGVGVLAGKLFDRLGRATVRIALAEDRIDGAAEHLAVAGADSAVLFGDRLVGVVRDGKAVGLNLGDGGLELRHRGADVGQLDDVGFGAERQLTEFGERVARLLLRRQPLREVGDDATGERDVAKLNVNTHLLCEGLHHRQEGVGGERGGFVGVGVDDGRVLAHGVTRWRAHDGGGFGASAEASAAACQGV